MDALTKLKYRKDLPRNVDIMVVRFAKTGVLGSSRPCAHCLESLNRSNLSIKYVYYSTCDGTIVKEKFNNMQDESITYVSSGIRKGWKQITKSEIL